MPDEVIMRSHLHFLAEVPPSPPPPPPQPTLFAVQVVPICSLPSAGLNLVYIFFFEPPILRKLDKDHRRLID